MLGDGHGAREIHGHSLLIRLPEEAGQADSSRWIDFFPGRRRG
jgi:hypothetical protein